MLLLLTLISWWNYIATRTVLQVDVFRVDGVVQRDVICGSSAEILRTKIGVRRCQVRVAYPSAYCVSWVVPRR